MPRLTHLVFIALATLATPAVSLAGPGDGPAAERPGRGGAPGMREERFLRALQTRDAARYAKVMEIRKDRPMLYRNLVGQTVQQIRGQRDGEARDKVRALIDQVYTLKGQLDRYEAADTKGQKRLVPEIQATIGVLFELRQDLRRRQLAAMEDRLSKLRGEIEERDANKDAIVEEFTSSMLGGVKGGF